MSAIRRIVSGVQSVRGSSVERRAYLARLRFLLKGTEGIQPWSLEHRSGLTGKFAIPAERLLPESALTIWCPQDCPAHSPLGHLYERRFVYRLSDTIASSASGATLAGCPAESAFFVRESIAWPFESVLAHGLEIPRPAQARTVLEQPAAAFPANSNYYHWLIEELPLALRAHEVAPDAALVTYEAAVNDRHRLVASALGAELITAPLVINLRQQILPGRAADSFFPHPEDVRRLRDFGELLTEAHSPAGATHPTRIYVSRKNSRRPLPDEEQVEHGMRSLGFDIVYLESTPWVEQIRMFRHAQIVVGPHGAGLSNLAFAAPGTTVVELTNGYMFNRCFEWLSHVAGLRYRQVQADSANYSTAELLNLVEKSLA